MIKKDFSPLVVHPEILKAIEDATRNLPDGRLWMTEACSVLRDLLRGEPYFVLTRTAANVLGLHAILNPHQAVICEQRASINVAESGAFENYTGSKLIAVETDKLTIEQITKLLEDSREPRVQPYVISISQPTFYGSVYKADEMKILAEFAHSRGMLIHMDGAYLANAAAFLGCSLREVTAECGIDVLSFAPSELLVGGAVLFFKRHCKEFPIIQEQGMQRLPDMSFIAAQFIALSNLWLSSAQHANRMAALLANKLEHLDDVDVARVQTHIVCVRLGKQAAYEDATAV